MLIKCSFCDAAYDSDNGHTCPGNHAPPPYRRKVPAVEAIIAAMSEVTTLGEPESYARDLLKIELVRLRGEREAIEMDYEAYKLVHEPMIKSLVDALGKL